MGFIELSDYFLTSYKTKRMAQKKRVELFIPNKSAMPMEIDQVNKLPRARFSGQLLC